MSIRIVDVNDANGNVVEADWLAAAYGAWFGFTEWLTKRWSDAERRGFYRGNAMQAYGL